MKTLMTLRYKLKALAVGLAATLIFGLGVMLSPSASAADNCAVLRQAPTQKITACAGASQLTAQSFWSVWRDSVSNLTAETISATCKATTTGTLGFTYSFTASGTVKAWVFADVSAKVSGGIKGSITTGVTVSSSFNVPPWRTTNCDRGIVRQNFNSRITETTINKGRPPIVTYRSHTGYGPVRAQWQIKAL